MSLPGSSVAISDAAAAPRGAERSGTLTLIGTSERGPAYPVRVRSPRQLADRFGKDVSYGDIIPLGLRFFARGGRDLLVRRDVGPGATVGTANLLNGSAAATVSVTTKEPGAWSTTARLTIVDGVTAGTKRAMLFIDDVELDRSPEVATKQQLVDWRSDYVTLGNLAGADLPINQTVTLSAGNDDRANISTTTFGTVLDSLTYDLGGGQISAPAYRQAAHRIALAEHARAKFRLALVDEPDTATISALKSAVTDIPVGNRRYVQPITPNIFAPLQGASRTLPASIDLAAAYAVSDRAAEGFPHRAAAGPKRGIIDDATGLARTFADTDAEQINDAGITLVRSIGDQVVIMGARTASARLGEEDAPGMRVVLQMARDMQIVIDNEVFEPDTEAAEIVGRCAAVAIEYFGAGAIVGTSPADACRLTYEVKQVTGGVKRLVINASVLPPGFLERIDLTIGKRF